MNEVKTYNKFLNKVKLGLEKHYNVRIIIEFNGLLSSFNLNSEGKFDCKDIPQYLIDIQTENDVNYLDLYEHFQTISCAMVDILCFRYSLNGKYIHPLDEPKFFI
jgi:hypothetical protein